MRKQLFKGRQIIYPYNQYMIANRLIVLSILVYVCSFTDTALQIEVGADAAPKPFDYKAAHKLFMLYGWTIFADIIVLLAFYEYRRYTKILHAILGVGLVVTTLATSMPSLIKNGISAKRFQHYLMGVIIYGVMGLQLLLGVIKFGFIFFNKGNSFAIYIIKSIHKYLGYALLIVCKVQVFLMLSQTRNEYSILVGWEIAVGIIFFYRLFTFPKLTGTIIPELYVKKKITCLSELQAGNDNKDYIIFGNYVYDIQPLKIGHPAGYKVIEAIKNESSDKYLYGMYGSQVETRLPRYSHSEASLKVMGKPQAQIDITSPFQGFQKDVVKVKVVQVNEISKHIYEMKLVKNEGFNFIYRGYSNEAQLGRFYSLTADRKITRLYTTVNFLHKNNKDLLRMAYFQPNHIQIDYEIIKSEDFLINQSTEGSEENELSLLIKKYAKGNFTKLMHELHQKKLQLSCQRGFGLSIPSLQPGRVVVAVGGTGIYPFCDLIDLLFKDCLRKRVEPAVAARILSQNPILSRNPFQKLTFEFLGSFHCLDDIHRITLHQALYLCKHQPGFKFIFRIKKKIPQNIVKQLGIVLTHERFESLLGDEIMKANLSKVWVCGPPRMNSSIRGQIQKMLTRTQFQIM